MPSLLRSVLACSRALAVLVVAVWVMPATGQSDEVPEELRPIVDAVRSGRVQEAIARLEPIAARADAPPQAPGILGALYVDVGRSEEALELLGPLAEGETPDPAVLYNVGRAAAALDRTALARGYFERSLQLEPRSPASLELGRLDLGDGRPGTAYLWLRRWLALAPNDGSARLAAARAAIELGRTTEARALLTGVDVADPQARLLEARTLELEGDGWGALALLNQLKTSAPTSLQPDVDVGLARAYLRIGQPEVASESLSGSAALSRPEAVRLLALAQGLSDEPEKALATLAGPVEQALLSSDEAQTAQAAQQAEILELNGRLLVELGRYEEALPSLLGATRRRPWHLQAWKGLAEALAAAGRSEEAESARNIAVGLEQTRSTLMVRGSSGEPELDATGEQLLRAIVLAQGEQDERAIEIVEHQQELVIGDDLRPGFVHVRVLMLLDRNLDALAVAQQQTEQAPFNADTYYQRGVVQMALGELEAAEEDYRRALELVPDHVAGLNDLAVLLIQKGESEEARALLQRVLGIRPGDLTAIQNLERLEGSRQEPE